MDTGDDLAYVDDEMDEDFVPPSKRHSPRRSLKPSSDVSMKHNADKSVSKSATGKSSRKKDLSSVVLFEASYNKW